MMFHIEKSLMLNRSCVAREFEISNFWVLDLGKEDIF